MKEIGIAETDKSGIIRIESRTEQNQIILLEN